MVYFDSIIIGAGAAGLMCSAVAGARGRNVLLLDHANKVGKKILMSGGGRCNFTNLYTDPSNFLCANPHFCKSALSRYTPYDFLDLVGSYHLEYHEKHLGQLFCDHKSKDILEILVSQCSKANVDVRTGCSVNSVEQADDGQFVIKTTQGDFTCAALVIATGGLSIPTMGASGFGFDIARQFGHNIINTDASLVPFVLTDKWSETSKQLAGVSIDVEVECAGQSFAEALLFTHRGLSGPAVLQISNYWHLGEEVTVNFLPLTDLSEFFNDLINQGDNSSLKNSLAKILPKRFVEVWLAQFDETILNKKIKQLDKKDKILLEEKLKSWILIPSGTEGYRTAEVTRGGINTHEISSKTFESRKVKNIYFIGEVLDVTGWLGGYNFQWAWSSAWCAGQYI